MTQSLPNWLPSWAVGIPDDGQDREDTAEGVTPLQHLRPVVQRPNPDTSLATSKLLPSSHTPDSTSDIDLRNISTAVRKERTVAVTPNQNRTVDRKLQGIHLFMITINATLGTGLYWRGGLILQLGGPLAVLLSFLLLGLLSWAVMQCITEMLCIWPIPGALSVYVSEFVDLELGIAVGVAYWYTYSVSFAALIATSAAEMHYWTNGNSSVDGAVMFFLIPLGLILLNVFDIKTYGHIEVFSGTVKVIFLFIIVIVLIAISFGIGATDGANVQYWTNLTNAFNNEITPEWGPAVLMSMSTAAFSYVGVEIVAASAMEVRWPKSEERTASDLSRRSELSSMIGKTVKFSAIWISVLATIAYSLSGILVSFNIHRTDCRLPPFSWAPKNETCRSQQSNNDTSSVFVAIAEDSGIPGLADAFNVFLVFAALTCAMTNLYVASRSLFGLTSRLDDDPGQPWFLRALAWLGKTNKHKVPLRAMITSALAFVWVPFLKLKGGQATSDINGFIEVLGNMGSNGVFIVWACECVAFLRFYHCIKRHRSILQELRIPQVRRWVYDDHDYPYRSHLQPFTGYMAFLGCAFLLVICNSAFLWNGVHPEPFLSSYLILIIFFVLWFVLKIVRGAKWALVDLSSPNRVVNKIRNLHDIRQGAR